MPLQSTEKAALAQASASIDQYALVLSGIVAALVADTAPSQLQAQLDAMTAERDALLSKIAEARVQILAANVADASEDDADTAGDAHRAAALQALG